MAFQFLILLSFLFLPLEPTDAGPPPCGEYASYVSCGRCDGTCERPKPPCSGCQPAGCYCLEGYVRDPDGRCIHPSQCDPRPRPTTRPPTTPRRPTPARTSIKPGTTRPPSPTRPFPPKTAPKPRPTTGPPPVPWKPQCPRYEIWLQYGACEGRCPGLKQIKEKTCKAPGCYCPKQDGYLRDASGRCIPKKECPWPPFPVCGPLERWKKCVRCEKFCEKDPRPCRQPCRSKCVCKGGYVRDWDGKTCVKRKQCKPHPDCKKLKCKPRHKCVWKPRWCHPKSPCLQCDCVPIKWFKSDKSDKSDKSE